ncbi:UNVERIFIED_CONTAM: Leucine-rich repeat extensin-like protein 2 [Sesamum angustifolium]|uniref:Cell wall hydroxyproline-rich glycoprotein n=1 Tax=Sesamum angustifolium TaxID=2727405 RepID=A0AAW2N4X3_9LAMI
MPPPSRRRCPSFLSLAVLVLCIFASQIPNIVAGEGDIDLDDINRDATSLSFENPSLRQAYIALQAWKKAIFSDPFNFTANWTGSDVCSYGGVFCAASLSNSRQSGGGIDLNHADIAGYLPDELGLLTDLALFHINSNRFCGVVPNSFKKLKLLFELDLSNNRFVGGFPKVVLSLPSLKFLDLRFNEFEGGVPSQVFDKDLDALFLNDNRFQFGIPENLGIRRFPFWFLLITILEAVSPAALGRWARL